MEIEICGVTFRKVDNETISVISRDGTFKKNIKYPASTLQELRDSANYYFVHCY